MAAERYGTTWWGKAWIDALEDAGSGSGYENRLPRGRTLARKGAVREIELHPGHIAARVVDRHGEIQNVDVAVKQLAPAEWEQVADAIAARAGHLAALLDGELDPGIVADADAVDVRLLPRPADLRPDCECEEWNEPCEHAAAVYYVTAAELDRNPFALFLLRGIGRDELIELVRSRRDGEQVTAAEPVEPPGMDAALLWAGHGLHDPLPPPPTASGRGVLRHPGRHVPWEAQLPARFGITTAYVDELAEDAIDRAWRMLVDDRPSGLAAPARADLARRAAFRPEDVVELAARAGLTPGHLRNWAAAWQIGGDDAVEVVADSGSWSTDQVLLAAGRDELVAMGHPRRSVALNYDSLLMASTVWLVLGRDHRWYRLQGPSKHQELRLTASPSTDLRDLVDPPST